MKPTPKPKDSTTPVNPLRLHILLGGIQPGVVAGTDEELLAYIHNPFYLQQIMGVLELLDRYSSQLFQTNDPLEVMRIKAKLEVLTLIADFPARALVSDKATPPQEQREELLNYIKEKFYGRHATDATGK